MHISVFDVLVTSLLEQRLIHGVGMFLDEATSVARRACSCVSLHVRVRMGLGQPAGNHYSQALRLTR